MEEKEIAKNLLLDRNCDNCKYISIPSRRCRKGGALDLFNFCPDENICKDWKKDE